ncbi:hypothetical protein I4641_12835 [Waterburya agarophytonicola K14]|uniref:LCCL domain-containing protein n=1 Tax=Waterburya agarophytonicola KI4 TaxID=2874699 RepID=A0A964BSS6_9CYAN|nr:LCCL domain-containing protein [Waterburya agarophytonicola]MCC0177863.1 hypothetical protein [Waterburya agarophytonicola KI4]
MKVIQVKHNFKLATLGLAIAISAISIEPVHAEKSNKSNKSVPEIGWSSRISSMGLDKEDNVGKKYEFDCQALSEDSIHAPIWGTKVYTVNSGICSSAVHAGMLEAEEGGKVTITLLEGKGFYTGSKKNDVISEDHSATDMGFSFVGKQKVVANQPESKSPKKKREPSSLERVLMDGFQRGVERSIEKTISDILN